MNESSGDKGRAIDIFDTRAFAFDPTSFQKGSNEQQYVRGR